MTATRRFDGIDGQSTVPAGDRETPTIVRSDAPDTREQVREHEPTYQSDLRGLIALSQRRDVPATPEEPMCLDAPPSVREAIRATGALLPTAAPAPVRRVRLAALPVIALAIVGVTLAAARRTAHWDRPAPPVTPVASSSSPIPPFAEAFSPLSTPSSVATNEPWSLIDSASSVPAPPPAAPVIATAIPAHAPPPAPSPPPPPRRAIAVAPPPVTAAPAPPAPPAPATLPELPSLMDAITDAVRSSPTTQNRR